MEKEIRDKSVNLRLNWYVKYVAKSYGIRSKVRKINLNNNKVGNLLIRDFFN